jgi:MHS family proline/betaine transporter-like MFS transporter
MGGTSKRRALGGAAIGNFGEIYDFAVFGLSVPILAAQFFPLGDPLTATLSVFAVYAVAFFARPVGGLVFGYFLDRVGRVKVLAITIWLMAIGTAAIGALPTYGTIGVAAPMLLVLCRLTQGFALGGETTGSMTFILETAPPGRRGLWIGIVTFVATVPNAFVALMLLALQTSMGAESYASWGWRIPFLLGGLVGVVGFWLRRSLEDPEEFKASKRSDEPNPLRAAAVSGRRAMLNVALIQPIQTVGAYLVIGFFYTFLVRDAGMDTAEALLSNAIAVMVMAFAIPAGGWLGDRYGRKTVLSLGALWIAAAAYPSLALASTGQFTYAVAGQALIASGVGLYSGAAFVAAVEFFPVSFRATGHAIAYQLSIAVFGGTTPIISNWLIGKTDWPLAPAIYVVILGLLNFVAIQFVPETAEHRLRRR